LSNIRRRKDVSTIVNKGIGSQIVQNLSQVHRLMYWKLRKAMRTSRIAIKEKTRPKGSLLLRQN
jgi:hypothetical protein